MKSGLVCAGRKLLRKAEGAGLGAAELLGQAIDCWGDDVLRLANSMLGNRADAEDVFQTVFLRLFSSGLRFADGEHTKAWLLRVTINCCKDELKGARRRRVVPLEAAAGDLAAAATSGEEQLPGPLDGSLVGSVGGDLRGDDRAEASGGADGRLQEALAGLSTKQRVALHLFYHDGYRTDEIAAVMEEAPSTVRSHLRRARQRLKTELGGHDA
jgi:RNA polymerase sigma-70 factor (ECF subfamily)